MGEGSITNDGCNLSIKRNYGEAGYSKVEDMIIGQNQTDPTVLDSSMTPADSLSTNLNVLSVPKTSTLIDDCSNPANWAHGGQASADAANTALFKEGYGTSDRTSLDLGKSGVAADNFYYSWNGVAFDAQNSWIYLWVYIDDAATLAKLKTASECLWIYFSDNPWIDYDVYKFVYTDLQIGWNLVCCEAENATAIVGLGCDWSAVTDLRIEFYTNNIGDTIASGKIAMDFWHYSINSEYPFDMEAGYPTYDLANRKTTTKYKVTSVHALGYNLGDVGEHNTDSPRVMVRRDTHDQQVHSSKDEIYCTLTVQFNPV